MNQPFEIWTSKVWYSNVSGIQMVNIQWGSEYQTLMFQRSENSKMVHLLDQCSNDHSNSQHLVTRLGLVYYLNVYYCVVCCCKLNNTRVCDDHLFGQVSTFTSRNQLPKFCCTSVHLGRHTHLLIYACRLRWVMSQNKLTTIGTTFIKFS